MMRTLFNNSRKVGYVEPLKKAQEYNSMLQSTEIFLNQHYDVYDVEHSIPSELIIVLTKQRFILSDALHNSLL